MHKDDEFYIGWAAHPSSKRLSMINATVDPIELARSSCSGRGKSTNLVTRSASITPFFLSPLLQPPLLVERRYNLHERWLRAQLLSRALLITLCRAVSRQYVGSPNGTILQKLPSVVPKLTANLWSSSSFPNRESCCFSEAKVLDIVQELNSKLDWAQWDWNEVVCEPKW